MALVVGGVAEAQTIRGQLLEFGSDQPIDLGLIIMVSDMGDSITSTLTTSTGFFEVSAEDPGSYLLLAAALGYRETEVGVFELGHGGAISVEFRMWPEPLTLDGLVVESLVQRPELVGNGFYRRMQRGVGSFFTPSDIASTPALRAIDMLQGLAGTRLTIDSSGGERILVRGTRGYCVPQLIVDGNRVAWEETSMRLDELVPLETLYAAEVHRGASGVPIEFGSFNTCGLIVFWTRSGRR